MKSGIKAIASMMVILFIFMNVSVNFDEPDRNGHIVQIGADKAYAAKMSTYNKYNVVYLSTYTISEPYTIDDEENGGSGTSDYKYLYKSFEYSASSGFGYMGTGKYYGKIPDSSLDSYIGAYYCTEWFAYRYFGTKHNSREIFQIMSFIEHYIDYKSDERVDHYVYSIRKITADCEKGTLVESGITAEDGTYPENGVENGYWYVKKTPELSILNPVQDSKINTSFTPSISVSDSVGETLTCSYYLDSEAAARETKQVSNAATAQNVSFQTLDIGTLGEGAHTITFEAYDGGTVSAKKTIAFTIDRTPPEINPITYTASESGITITGSVKAGTSDLNALPYRYTINGVQSDWTTDTSYLSGILSPNTKYSAKFEARDALENIALDQKEVCTKAQKPSLSLAGAAETTLDLKITDSNPAGTEYQITAGSKYVSSDGTLTGTAQWNALTSKTITIKGLQQNTGYTVSGRTRNADLAESDAAQASSTTLAKSPDITFPEVSQTVIKLAWNAVSGAASYEVEADGFSIGQVTQSVYVHNGLTAETEHKYRIRVINAGGTGNWSSYYSMATAPYPPAVPTNIEAIADQTTVTLTWDKTAKATSYEIEINGGATPVNVGNVLTYTDKGLVPDTEYKYRIRAKNSGGVGDWSGYITIATLPEPPPTPSGITVKKTNTSATISWSPAERAETYRIEADGQIIDNGTQTSYTHEGLTSLSSHKYRIKAVNKGGGSGWSDMIYVITNPDKPETPANIIATSDTESISLTWYKTLYAESYEVEIDGSSTTYTTGAAFTHDSLEPDSSHTYRVKAINVTGVSEWSKPLTISTFPEESGETEDTSLTNVIAIVTNNNILLSWDDVTTGGAYEIEVDGKVTDNGKSTVYNHTGLTAETYHTYKIRVKDASDSAGTADTSDWCAVLTLATMPDIPDAPTGLSAAASNNSIEIRWERVEGTMGYDIELDGKVADAGEQEGYIQESLDPGTTHTYRVRARNISGVTAWSEAISESTTNPIYTVECIKNGEFSLSLTASDVQDFTGFAAVVTYNADELDVVDLYGFTPEMDTFSEGTITGTKVKVKYEQGRIIFTMDENITPGTMWSGEISNIIFMSKVTGKTQINFLQE